MTKHEAYKMACEADDVFESALDAQFGRNHVDMRYDPREDNETTQAARKAYHLACEHLHNRS